MQKSRLLAATVAVLTLTFTANHADAAPSGWQVARGEKGKPVVLLVHGLTASSRHWTQPAHAWNLGSAHFDHHHTPGAHARNNRASAGVGIYKLGSSNKPTASVDRGNWFTFLRSKGYTVATWDQVPCIRKARGIPATRCLNGDTFAKAVRSARAAYAEIQKIAKERGSKIALIGHSRGGLVIRQLLKDTTKHPRLGWVITLHTPHQGSAIATLGIKMQGMIPAWIRKLPRPLRKYAAPIKNANMPFFNGMVKIAGMSGARELGYNSSMMKALRRSEHKVNGVKYYSFGGTSTTLNRFYVWSYTAGSARPNNAPCGIRPRPCRFNVRANPSQIPGISPFRTTGSDPEIKHGHGDTMVAASRSVIPFVEKNGHQNNALHHGEVLWSRGVQNRVHAYLTPRTRLVRMRLLSGGNRLGKPERVAKSFEGTTVSGSATTLLTLQNGVPHKSRAGKRLRKLEYYKDVRVLIGNHPIMYVVNRKGTLYFLFARRGGTPLNPIEEIWASKIGGGWNQFRHVVGGYDGIIYAVKPNGALYWYRDLSRKGKAKWAKTQQIGSGWNQFRYVFGGRGGRLFAVRPNGQLFKYQHKGYRSGSKAWERTVAIGTGWQRYSAAMDGGDGYIYAIERP